MWTETLPNGKIRVCERYTDVLTGKSKKISVTIEKASNRAIKAAEEVLRQKIEEAASNVTPIQEITLKELAEAYRADQKQSVRASTYTRNKFAIDTIMSILGEDTLVSKLTAPYVRKKLLETGKSSGTLNEHLKRFKAMIRWGFRNDLIKDISYLDKLPNFKAPPHRDSIRDKYLESDELKSLLNGMDHAIWKLLTKFLSLSGLRIGEAIALDINDIDFKAKQIHVAKAYDSVNEKVSYPKNSSSIRDVDMQPELEKVCRDIIREMKKFKLQNAVPKTKLFLFDKNGFYIDYYAYNKYLKENALKVLGREITPHTLRHTHASLLMEQGIPIDVISRRLGHENSKITKEIYLHVTKKLKEKDGELIKAVSFF